MSRTPEELLRYHAENHPFEDSPAAHEFRAAAAEVEELRRERDEAVADLDRERRFLRPCPFCGRDDASNGTSSGESVINGFTYARDWFFVECGCCEAKSGEHRQKQNAIDAWNRRAGEDR